MKTWRLLPLLAFISIVPLRAFAQTTQTILQGLAATFSKGKPVHSVTLNATAQWVAGSDNETGSATLTASADGSSGLQLQLSQSTRTEAQTSFSSGQTCNWSGTDGIVHQAAAHNCLASMTWFLPVVSLLGGQQPVSMTTSLANTASAQTLIDLRQQQAAPTGMDSVATRLYNHLTTTDLYVDPLTLLPSGISYQAHPDANAGADIPVEVTFSNYQVVDGVSIPFRIQRYINGTLNLDLTVTHATAN